MGAQLSFLDHPDGSRNPEEMPGDFGALPDDAQAKTTMFEGASDVTINGGTLNAIGRDMVQTRTTVNNIVINLVDSTPLKDTEILNWLSVINFRAIQMGNFDMATPGTCAWFLESMIFKHWLLTHAAILWGTGMPGSGKTILASIVIDFLQKYARQHGPKIAVVFAYCRYTEHLSVQHILSALIRQLLERYPFLWPLVQPLYEQHRREMTKPSKAELIELLNNISQVFERFFCAVDGLDEAAPDDQFKILDALSIVKANYFFTSRPLEPLHCVLPTAQFFHVVAHDQDIKLMVDQKLAMTPRAASMLNVAGEDQKREVVLKITLNARGMFLHAAMQIETVLSAVSIRDALDNLSRLPLKIADMYRATMKRIDSQPEASSKLARRILLWLLHANEPMKPDELSYALAINTNFPDPSPGSMVDKMALVDKDTMLSACCGLISVDMVGYVRFIHKTAYESLTTILDDNCAESHATMAIACIRWLGNPGALHTQYPRLNWLRHVTGAQDAFIDPSKPFIFELLTFIRRHSFSHPSLPSEISPSNRTTLISPSPGNLEKSTSHPPPYPTPIIALSEIANAYPGLLLALLAVNNEQVSAAMRPLVNTTDEEGRSLLMVISIHTQQHQDCVEKLIRSEAVDINQADNLGMTALHHAIRRRDKTLISALLQHPSIDVNKASGDGATPLILAVSIAGHRPTPDIVKELLADPRMDGRIPDSRGYTPLMIASEKGSIPVVETFLTHLAGSEAHQARASEDASIALQIAIRNARRHLTLSILEHHGALIDKRSARFCFWWCLCDDDPSYPATLEALISIPHLVDAQKIMGLDTLRVLAAPTARATIVEHLIASNARGVSSIDDLDWDNDDLASTLVKLPPNPIPRQGNREPFAAALRRDTEDPIPLRLLNSSLLKKAGDRAFLQRLLASGDRALCRIALSSTSFDIEFLPSSNMDIIVEEAAAVLMTAAKQGLDKIIDNMISIPGVDPNVTDDKGWTPLMWASWEGHFPAVLSLVLSDDTQENIRDSQGRTAWHLAQCRGYSAVMTLLDPQDPPADQSLPHRIETPVADTPHLTQEGKEPSLKPEVDDSAGGDANKQPRRSYEFMNSAALQLNLFLNGTK